MAFKNMNFGVMAYCAGFSVWVYNTKDAAVEVLGDGYFNPAYAIVNNGDLVMCVCNEGTMIRVIKIENNIVKLVDLL